jgi:hypothetical protein
MRATVISEINATLKRLEARQAAEARPGAAAAAEQRGGRR